MLCEKLALHHLILSALVTGMAHVSRARKCSTLPRNTLQFKTACMWHLDLRYWCID